MKFKLFPFIAAIADTIRWINVGLALVHYLRRWTTVKPTLIQRLESAGGGGGLSNKNFKWAKIAMCTESRIKRYTSVGSYMCVITWQSHGNSCHLRYSCSELYADCKKIGCLFLRSREGHFSTTGRHNSYIAFLTTKIWNMKLCSGF